MPAPKLIHTYAYFRRESAGVSDRDNQPTLTTSDGIGTVTSVEYRNEPENQIFDKPVGGRWVDYDVMAVRDRETFTLELTELSELFWKLLRQANPTLVSGGATYVPGENLVTRGWLQLDAQDEDAVVIDTLMRWCHLEIESHTFGKGSIVTARVTGRKLYSTLNTGTWASIV